jgi:hypothetical protein
MVPLFEGAAAQNGLQTGPDVSYLIKTDTATIPFDVGNNPAAISPSPLERNMAALGLCQGLINSAATRGPLRGFDEFVVGSPDVWLALASGQLDTAFIGTLGGL